MNGRRIVVDDHLLLSILLDREPSDLRPLGASVSTTGLWYHRLCRAVADHAVTGAMSRQLGSAEPELGALAVRAVIELPDSIGLTSLRALGWPMAELIASEYRLNLLSAEALAAAEVLGAEICLAASDANPPLIEAAKRRGVPLRVIEV